MPSLRQVSFVTIALAGTTACASLNTHNVTTWVPGGSTYRIGEGERSTFDARVKNTGQIPVTIMLDSGGVKRSTVLLRPDSTFTTVLGGRQIAMIANSASKTAKVKIWTHTHGMRVTVNAK